MTGIECEPAELISRHTLHQTVRPTSVSFWSQTVAPSQFRRLQTTQELSSCWDGRPFGHNRHGPKVGRGCCGGWVPTGSPSNTMWSGPRPTSLPSGIFIHPTRPFGHNCRNATLLRVGIRLRTIFIPSLVVKTFTGCVHWVIAQYPLNSSK